MTVAPFTQSFVYKSRCGLVLLPIPSRSYYNRKLGERVYTARRLYFINDFTNSFCFLLPSEQPIRLTISRKRMIRAAIGG